MGFHFFEVPNTQIARLPTVSTTRPGEFLPGALQHIAVTIADDGAALALRDRLIARNIPVTPIIEPSRFAPGLRIFLFPDPSGLLLKPTWVRVESV